MKLKNINLKTKGFTIIEVVLVLAIAGLIIAAVFIAVPGLQAGQRDTARKNDVSAVLSQVSTYASNNNGSFPTGDSNNEWTNSGVKLSSNSTKIKIVSTVPTLTDGEIYVTTGKVCNTVGANSVTLSSGTTNQVAVYTILEQSNKTGYCVSN